MAGTPKRKFPAIPEIQVQRQEERLKPRTALQAQLTANPEILTKEASRKEQSYYTGDAGKSQEEIQAELEKKLDKDYVPRKQLSGILSDVMGEFAHTDYGVQIVRKRGIGVTYTAPIPTMGDGPTERVETLSYRVESQSHRNPCRMLYNARDAVGACGDWLQFGCTVEGVKLRHASFCRHRLCPMCNWRRGVKVFSQLKQILDYLKPEEYRYIALTLTVRNCTGENLNSTIEEMLEGWRNLTHDNSAFGNGFWRKWRGELPVVAGYFRSLEITLNADSDTFHPHFHVLLAVRPEYYKADYKDKSSWIAAWRKALNLDYDPSVSIQAVDKSGSSGSDFGRVVYDVSKADMGLAKNFVPLDDAGGVDDAAVRYISKGGDKYAISYDFLTLDDNDEIRKRRTHDLFVALYSRRLVSFSGAFRQARKDLNLTDPEMGPLTDDVSDDGEADADVVTFTALWSYGAGGYKVKRVYD